MKSFLLNTLDDIRTSYWFIPAIMAVGAIVLSFCAIQFDASLDGQGPDWMSWLFDNQPEIGVTTAVATKLNVTTQAT